MTQFNGNIRGDVMRLAQLADALDSGALRVPVIRSKCSSSHLAGMFRGFAKLAAAIFGAGDNRSSAAADTAGRGGANDEARGIRSITTYGDPRRIARSHDERRRRIRSVWGDSARGVVRRVFTQGPERGATDHGGASFRSAGLCDNGRVMAAPGYPRWKKTPTGMIY
jgi:hypothetical protein